MTWPASLVAGLALAAALLAAGCGGETEPDAYSLEPTQDCLEEAGYDASTEDLDFVASTATGGAFHTDVGENEVTLSFGETTEEAERTAQAYRNFAGPTIQIEHVLFQRENVVFVWGAPPTDEERGPVEACLRG
jgi:hypothetical protein